MKTETVYVKYAHCVKFTAGQLDRDPFSKYELREVPVSVVRLAGDPLYPWISWQVWHEGKVLACEDEREDALALAEYALMDNSRCMTGNVGHFLQAMKGQS